MSECPIVETSLGKAKGKVHAATEGGKNVFLYTRLPFAKPPIGDLRFEKPVSPDPWNGVLDASKNSSAPMQNQQVMENISDYMPGIVREDPYTFSEDCLYLSVYTSNPSKAANLPVLFWFYGGGFSVGGEAFYDASVLASLHDVVVVIPNYRVSIFGFLSFGRDTDYTGNAGLYDQIMALKWTKQHIQAFGGNPEKVTLFGESAGAFSVSYHIMSPLSTGLFHQGISHSGTFFTNGMPPDSGEKPLKALLEKLKITEDDPKILIKKLKSLPADELTAVAKALEEQSFLYFGPVYDGKFFPKDISTMKKEPITNNVPYIVGCNNTEGHGILSSALYPKGFKTGLSRETCVNFLKLMLGNSFCVGLPDVGYDAIFKEYEKDKDDDDKLKWSKLYGEVTADTLFISSSIEALKQHLASKGKAYFYVMTQQLKFNHDPAYGPESARKAEFCECDHGDDVIFTFGMPLDDRKLTFDAKFTEDEKNLSKEWLKCIVNFATNGDPNIGLPVTVKWPEYKWENRQHLSVQQPCSVGTNYGVKVHKFWREVVEPMRIKGLQDKKN